MPAISLTTPPILLTAFNRSLMRVPVRRACVTASLAILLDRCTCSPISWTDADSCSDADATDSTCAEDSSEASATTAERLRFFSADVLRVAAVPSSWEEADETMLTMPPIAARNSPTSRRISARRCSATRASAQLLFGPKLARLDHMLLEDADGPSHLADLVPPVLGRHHGRFVAAGQAEHRLGHARQGHRDNTAENELDPEDGGGGRRRPFHQP